jgi:hypothetical protein
MGFRLNGNDKLIYNHSSSYPEWLGNKIATALANLLVEDVGETWLRNKVESLEMVTNDQEPTPEQIERLSPHTNLRVSNQSTKDWYCLTSGLQGDLLKTLNAGLAESADRFILDSLFCEWAYIVNLDTKCLEIYKGFQRTPHGKGRYFDLLPSGEFHRGADQTYYPCALVCEIPFNQLATANITEIVKGVVGNE